MTTTTASGTGNHLHRRQSALAKMSDIQSLAQSMCSIDLPDSNWIQDLPCLPVPDLKKTLDRYLGSLKPVISEQQYNQTMAIVGDFMRHEGPRLQRDLKEYANKCQNWATDFWLDDMYLSNPLPLPINSNPLFLFPRQTFNSSDDMLMFATRIIQFAVDFKFRIDRQTLSQDYGSGHGKGKPLCMETYKNFFHSCRTPHEDKDRLLRQSRRSNHIVVASCNQFYILRLGQDPLDNPYRSDLPPLDEACIFDQLSRIYRVSREQALRNLEAAIGSNINTTGNSVSTGESLSSLAKAEHESGSSPKVTADGDSQEVADSTLNGATKDDSKRLASSSSFIPKIGLLTTENRKLWAKLHKRLCKNEINLQSISQIEDCLFVMCLDSLVSISSNTSSTSNPPEAGSGQHQNTVTSVISSNTTNTTNTPSTTINIITSTIDESYSDETIGEGKPKLATSESERQKMATIILTGGGCNKFTANRWFDKFLQVIVGRDGVCGINIEHSASEGITVLRFLEEFPEYLAKLNQQQANSNNSSLERSSPASAALTRADSASNRFDFSGPAAAAVNTNNNQSSNTAKTSSGRRRSVSSVSSSSSGKTSSSFVGPASPSLLLKDDKITPLEWQLDDEIFNAINEAQSKMDKMIENFDFRILDFQEFGKEFIKSHNFSPDAFIQLALQLTYYKAHHQLVSTYESASLRQFRLGRVDNIRANTCEVLDWVKAMTGEDERREATNNEGDAGSGHNNDEDHQTRVNELFKKAIQRQVEILRYTITGSGPDNHLLALRELARVRYDQLPKLYEDPSYAEFLRFKLSTSQLPSERGITVGYGAVVPDGYGCSYNPCENYIVFCIASFVDCPETSSELFATNLRDSLREMKQLCLRMSASATASVVSAAGESISSPIELVNSNHQ